MLAPQTVIVNILRHAIAEMKETSHPDAERALTREGRDKLRAILKRARRADVSPSVILTSPLRRAVESAGIAAKIFRHKNELVVTKALSPQSTPEKTWQEIRRHADQAEILLTGHEPHLSKLTAYLLGFPGLAIEIKKGALVRIRIDEISEKPKGVLEWMLVPKLTI